MKIKDNFLPVLSVLLHKDGKTKIGKNHEFTNKHGKYGTNVQILSCIFEKYLIK